MDEHGNRKNGEALRVTTYNVRGLKEEAKLRHLLNYFHKACSSKNKDFVACLQEVYLESPGKIPYLWRGNYHLTPGMGNSGGCVTLLSSHINVVSSRNLGNRAHVLACQKADETSVSLIIANIYAPNPNSQGKIDFFNEVFDTVHEIAEQHACNNVIIAGDFNLTMGDHEMKNRMYSSQEKRVSSAVKDMIDGSNLKDIWSERRGFTWRRANSDCFSTIDRILYCGDQLKLGHLNQNWSLSFSDHAAIESGFSYVERTSKPRQRIPRIDPSLTKSPELSAALFREVNQMLQTMPNSWDPHMKLEFSKVCIRTVAERIQAERKRVEKREEDILNDELNEAVTILENEGLAEYRTNALIEQIEELRAKKAVLVDEKGRRLAERLGSKWYNEGEKSTRYFMRLLNRPTPDDFKKITREDGIEISDPEQIKDEISQYYRKLYEDFEVLEEVDDQTFFANILPVSDESDQAISSPLTIDELRATLQTCKDSSPGPDGIPYSVIGLMWPVYGQLLLDSWNFSLEKGKLPPSHKTSYLKLIPKMGKDLSKLTNWRPITLSNCDHKIITKTFSKRMCEHVASRLEERQTAYLKGRLINDNIRSMIATIGLTQEENLQGLIVSLDAKKAFDSVNHKYIEKCLERFGCQSFIPIFRTLYNELSTDIIINGRIEKGFKILRGVKQGDALSCIIFIICMEPLLSNIQANVDIEPIPSRRLNALLPKSYAYADDVNATICDSERSLKALFQEYERLTKQSGLELNADKTEILRLNNDNETTFNVRYLNKMFNLTTIPKIKVNGIVLQKDLIALERENADAICQKMNQHLKKWSRRNLTTLGKILIVKTFGISQLIYFMQTLVVSSESFKKFNAMLYKFIWNRHFLAAKAPERIKRDIVNLPTKLGGLGMLDIVALDDSIKIKAIGRLKDSQHPFLKLVKENIDFEQFFNPRPLVAIENFSRRGCDLVKEDRLKLLRSIKLRGNRILIGAIREMQIRLILSRAGQQSLTFFMIWSRGARKIKDLTQRELGDLRRYINPESFEALRTANETRIQINDPSHSSTYFINGMPKLLSKCTSKEIRLERAMLSPLCSYKIGLNLERSQALSWGLRVSKLTSTRHKNILLRVAHGDIYTKERLVRFGMAQDPLCPRCNEIETLKHKFIECDYIKRIWDIAFCLSSQASVTNPINEDPIEAALGAYLTSNITILTLNAELLLRINSLKEENYLLHPKFFVKATLDFLIRREKKKEVRDTLKSIRSSMDRQ